MCCGGDCFLMTSDLARWHSLAGGVQLLQGFLPLLATAPVSHHLCNLVLCDRLVPSSATYLLLRPVLLLFVYFLVYSLDSVLPCCPLAWSSSRP